MNFEKIDKYVDFQIELTCYNIRLFIYWKIIFSMLKYPENYKEEEYNWEIEMN